MGTHRGVISRVFDKIQRKFAKFDGFLLRDHDGPRRSPCCAAVERARGAAGRLSWADFEARVHYVLYCEDDWGTSDLGALHEGECGEPAPPEDR